MHLRQWVETFDDFKECHVRLLDESKSLHIRVQFGIGKNIYLLALVGFQKAAHRYFFCTKKKFEFWIDMHKWLESLKRTRKNNISHTLMCHSSTKHLEFFFDSNSKFKKR